MDGSYIQHSIDTVEFLEGKNAAIRGDTQNPYPCGKQYLDWFIGFDSIVKTEPVEAFVVGLPNYTEPNWFSRPWQYFNTP